VNDAAWSELLLELRVLWIMLVLRLLLGIQVVEIAEELVEPVVVGSISSRSPR